MTEEVRRLRISFMPLVLMLLSLILFSCREPLIEVGDDGSDRLNTYFVHLSVSGSVTLSGSGAGLEGATVVVSIDGSDYSVTTDINGNYSGGYGYTGLEIPEYSDYLVKPSKNGYSFSPTMKAGRIYNGEPVIGVNFIATALTSSTPTASFSVDDLADTSMSTSLSLTAASTDITAPDNP